LTYPSKRTTFSVDKLLTKTRERERESISTPPHASTALTVRRQSVHQHSKAITSMFLRNSKTDNPQTIHTTALSRIIGHKLSLKFGSTGDKWIFQHARVAILKGSSLKLPGKVHVQHQLEGAFRCCPHQINESNRTMSMIPNKWNKL